MSTFVLIINIEKIIKLVLILLLFFKCVFDLLKNVYFHYLMNYKAGSIPNTINILQRCCHVRRVRRRPSCAFVRDTMENAHLAYLVWTKNCQYHIVAASVTM